MWLYKCLVTKAILQQSYTVYPDTDHCQLCGLVHTSRGRCHLHAPVTSHLCFLTSHQCWKYLGSRSFWQYRWKLLGWMWFPVTVVWKEWFKVISAHCLWISAIPWDRWWWIMPKDQEDENGYLLTESRSSINLSKLCPVFFCAGLDPKCDGSRVLTSTGWIMLPSGCHFRPVLNLYTGQC